MEPPSQEQKIEDIRCPKCNAVLSTLRYRGSILYLRIIGIVLIVGSIILAASLSNEEITILAVFNVALGILFICRGSYWSARLVLKCKECGYARVKKVR